MTGARQLLQGGATKGAIAAIRYQAMVAHSETMSMVKSQDEEDEGKSVRQRSVSPAHHSVIAMSCDLGDLIE